MRGLSILTVDEFSHEDLKQFYLSVQRRTPNEEADALAYECLTMSLHNVSAIQAMGEIENPYPIVRSAIIAWYYATYYAAKAMLAASSGTNPQTHASAGKIWQAELVESKLIKSPFNLSISDITPSHVHELTNYMRGSNTHDLNLEPVNSEMAFGALCSYLKGTAEYEQWRIEEKIKDSSDYKQQGYTSFRSKAAKELRDGKLREANVNFLVQAFRYRGKANYRDAIYLSYGTGNTERVRQFITDLGVVGSAFSQMAAHYVSKRVIKSDWEFFAADIEQHARFDLSFGLNEI